VIQPPLGLASSLHAYHNTTVPQRLGIDTMSNPVQAEQPGLYCSTAGTYFTDKDALADHYKSDFHRSITVLHTAYHDRSNSGS
jgi:hypothetical protein